MSLINLPALARRLLLPAACLLAFTACGDDFGFGNDVDLIEADPLYFAEQIFDCDPETDTPTCPPYSCTVDETGAVSQCATDRCAVDNDSTAFEFIGSSGDLCVPPVCTVSAVNRPPECEAGCSEDDVTIYIFTYPCN